MTERLPFFVYGTLRPGGALASCWEDLGGEAWFDGDVLVPGYRLVYAHHRSFPYAIPADGRAIVGALVSINNSMFRMLLNTLDTVEGYPSHYNRSIVRAVTPIGQDYEAWLYTPPYRTIFQLNLEAAEAVPNNDWNHRHAHT